MNMQTRNLTQDIFPFLLCFSSTLCLPHKLLQRQQISTVSSRSASGSCWTRDLGRRGSKDVPTLGPKDTFISAPIQPQPIAALWSS